MIIFPFISSFYTDTTIHLLNQSAENAGVAFVKGAHERNYFIEKVNKQ